MSVVRCSSCGTVSETKEAGDNCTACVSGVLSKYADPKPLKLPCQHTGKITYSEEHDNFYCDECKSGMGDDYYTKWIHLHKSPKTLISGQTIEKVNHPPHYGAEDSPHECIECLEAWLTREQYIGFLRGNAIKYLRRADRKGDCLSDLKKALWYIQREIALYETK